MCKVAQLIRGWQQIDHAVQEQEPQPYHLTNISTSFVHTILLCHSHTVLRSYRNFSSERQSCISSVPFIILASAWSLKLHLSVQCAKLGTQYQRWLHSRPTSAKLGGPRNRETFRYWMVTWHPASQNIHMNASVMAWKSLEEWWSVTFSNCSI